MKIGLTMIVKDEAHVIGRCLDSVFSTGIIDYFAIVDTGSSDNTMEIIEQKAKQYDVQGVLITKWFTDFADCRNAALDGIRGKCDWAFWIDADEVLVNKSENLKSMLNASFEVNDYIWVEANQGNISFPRTNLFKITEQTRWKGKVHEYVTVSGIGVPHWFIEMSIDVYSEGNSWRNEKQKFIRYAKLLLEQIELEPEEPRWYYFLADTYRNMKTIEFEKKAIEYYEKRIAMFGGNEEEVFVSRLMISSLKKKLYKIYDYETLSGCESATRIEHYLAAAAFKMEEGKMVDAHVILSKAMGRVGQMPEASLFVDLKTYLFTVPFFFAVVCSNLEKIEELEDAIKICESAISCANEKEKHQLAAMKNYLSAIKGKRIYEG
jgi:glycosyltransferase involved in cell wall biosynthesis